MDLIVIGSLIVFGISVCIALYRRRLAKKVKKMKKEVEKLEAEKDKIF